MKINVPKRLKKTLIGVAIFFVLYTVIGFLVLPPIARSLIQKDVGAALHRRTTLRKVLINPYTFKVVLKGLTVREKDGAKTFLSFERLSINIQSISLFRKGIFIKEVALDKPYLHIVRKREHSFNISDLISGKKQRAGQPLQFTVGDVRISGGTIDFEDLPKGKRHQMTGIVLVVPFVSDRPDYAGTFVRPEFSGKIDGSPFRFTGRTVPFSKSRETFLDIDIRDFNLPYYFSYLPIQPGVALSSGRLNAKLRLSYSYLEKSGPSLSVKGTVGVRDVELKDGDGRPIIGVGRLAIDIREAGVFSRKVHIANVKAQSPSVHIRRDSRGVFNLASLIPAKREEVKKSAAPPAGKASPFSVVVDNLRLAGGSIEFSDAMKQQRRKGAVKAGPATITAGNVNISVSNLSTERNAQARLSMSADAAKGSIGLSGTASLNPLGSRLKIDVKRLDLATFQPFVADMLKIGIKAGKASASGSISLKAGDNGKYDVSLRGDAKVTGFSSVDSESRRGLLKWASLNLEGIEAGGNFSQISLKGFSLSGFYARVIVRPDGTLNVMDLLRKKEGPPAAAGAQEETKKQPEAPQAEGRKIAIGTSTLQGGTIDFTDEHIKPRYSAKLTDVTGRLSELSSAGSSPADVDLFGKWNGYAPLEITGKVNPFGKNLFVDLNIDFKDMDLSPLTPYSGKYIGYTIEKGKLALKLKYRIVSKALTAENVIKLDQLTLGKKVESPKAVKLPVKFAISLLKNRKGEIDLNVPVSGRTDDPKFSLGHVIMKAIGKFITRIITSPFRLLASLFGGGGGGELSYLEFGYGSHSLSPQNLKKLGTLIKALNERPELKLDIAGYVDPPKDRDSLRQITFQRKLSRQALRDMKASGKKPVPLDQVKIDPKERDKILWEAYKEEKFPRPTNFLGIVKKLPPAEMEKLILSHIVITDDNLRQLAHERANAARDYILNAKVDPDRVFLVEPGSLAPEKKEDIKNSRVVFTLK